MTETNTNSNSSWIVWLLVIVVIAFIIFKFQQGAKYNQPSDNLYGIQYRVAQDAEQQYEIAKRQGDKMQIYVQASLVAAAYLQAKDEANYQKWKEIEKQEAINAGLPQR